LGCVEVIVAYKVVKKGVLREHIQLVNAVESQNPHGKKSELYIFFMPLIKSYSRTFLKSLDGTNYTKANSGWNLTSSAIEVSRAKWKAAWIEGRSTLSRVSFQLIPGQMCEV
jgi:hypothetical protein